MLNNTCIGDFGLGIVNLSQTLEVWRVKDLILKSNGTIFQFSEPVIVEFVNLSCKHNLVELRIEN